MNESGAVAVAYIGLGANLGDPARAVRSALETLALLRATRLIRYSSLYGTAPMDADGDDYVNAVAALHTTLSSADLLLELQQLEQHFGRQRSYRNAPRTLDCDLLLYDQQIIDTPSLQVPHPRMHLRAFVLVPLAEIAPDIIIPGLGSVGSLLPSVAGQAIHKIA